MKFFLAAILASAVAPAFGQTEVSLEEKWRIVDTPTFEYSDLAFYMNFSVSEFITPDMSKAVLYTDGCAEDGALLANKTYLALEGTNGVLTDVVGERETYADYCVSNTCPIPEADEATFYSRYAGLKFKIDPATISSTEAGGGALPLTGEDGNTYYVYTETTALEAVTAQVRFCVRYSLYINATTADTEVNFLETIVTLDVDLSDGFTVNSIAVAPRDRLVRTAAQSYTCEAYFCDQNEVMLDEAALGATRNQGAALRVCVIPTEDARTDGVFMRRIDSFTWERDTTITQIAVENSIAAANGLTTLRCDPGDLICNFESILFAQFYATAGSVAGSGVCSMQFGGNGCSLANAGDTGSAATSTTGFGGTTGCTEDRRLRANRYLQNEDAATAEFDLSIDVNQGAAPLTDGTPSSASTASMAMAALAAGAALML